MIALLAGLYIPCAAAMGQGEGGAQHQVRSCQSGRGQSVPLVLVAQPALERSQPRFAGWAAVLLINGNIMKMAFSYYRSQLWWNYENTCYNTPLGPHSRPASGWDSPLNFTASVCCSELFLRQAFLVLCQSPAVFW